MEAQKADETCRQRGKLSAQQYLFIARRRLFLLRTIQRFESHFKYPLWQSEQQYLADLLKVERPGKYASYAQHALSVSQRLRSPAKSIRHLKKDDKRTQTALESDMTMVGEKEAEYASETADVESIEGDGKETEIALQWLGAEWESMVRILRQRESDCEWVDEY